TAEQLNRDLGAGLELPARPALDDREDLVRRIEALERRAFRQEQVFNRVVDLLESNAAGRV
ncbi:MAG TPA: ATPase, partial [Rhodopila sp.]